MSQIVCHRGFWWPRRDRQNHPASVIDAFSQGWSVEIDIWGSHGECLKIGHDGPDYEWTVPWRFWGAPIAPDLSSQAGGSDRSDEPLLWKNSLLFLHMKMIQKDFWKALRIWQILHETEWLGHVYSFWSPKIEGEYVDGVRFLTPVCNQKELKELLEKADSPQISGVWLEQPEEDWVTQEDVQLVHQANKTAWIISSELHDRKVDLGRLSTWKSADGIVTDFPCLVERVLDGKDPVVHPQEPWWL